MVEYKVTPVKTADRSDILDILRGFALLGICMANAWYNSMYVFQSEAAKASMPTPSSDRWLNYFHHTFIDGKFYTIFSLLFGIGFSIILYGKLGQGNRLVFFYRRLFFLLLFGFCHALLIWDGDILIFYAVIGTLLPLFRNFTPRALIIISMCLVASPLVFDLLKVISNDMLNISSGLRKAAFEQDQAIGLTEKNISDWLVVNNSYSDLLQWNRSGLWWSWQYRIESNRIVKVLGMFLLGLAVGKLNIYQKIEEFKPLLVKIMWWCFAIGLIGGIAKAYFEVDKINLPSMGGLLDTLAYALNVAPLGIAYCIAFAILHHRYRTIKLFDWLKPVGRMALTNYIAQSVISIAIYYGIGFGLASRVGPSFFIPMAVLIFSCQIIYSRLWLHYFEFGPLEWMWRQLSYGRIIPIRKPQAYR